MDLELYQQVKTLVETTERPLSVSDIMTSLRLENRGEPLDTVRRRISRILKKLEDVGVVRTANREGSSPGVATLWKATSPRKKAPLEPYATAEIALELLESFLTPTVHDLMVAPLRQIAPTLTTVAARQRLKERVITVPRRPLLLPPQGNTVAMSQVLDAILARRCFRAIYNSRCQKKETYQEYHGLGLVVRENTIYVVACLDWTKEVRHYALHRFTAFRAVPHKAVEPPDHFTLQKWLVDSDLGDTGKKVRLSLRMQESVAYHLQEMPLARDQALEPAGEGWVRIRATVHENEELVWWLLGLGASVEVLGPKALRAQVSSRLQEATHLYTLPKAKSKPRKRAR